MKNLTDLLKKERTSDLDQAKIVSINRITGRVVLAMRNGLISTGVYLYDIADLREGMSVLIGEVNGTHVILSKVENIPRNGSSFSIRKTFNKYWSYAFEVADNSWWVQAEGMVVYEGKLLLLSDESIDAQNHRTTKIYSYDGNEKVLFSTLPIDPEHPYSFYDNIVVHNGKLYVSGGTGQILVLEDGVWEISFTEPYTTGSMVGGKLFVCNDILYQGDIYYGVLRRFDGVNWTRVFEHYLLYPGTERGTYAQFSAMTMFNGTPIAFNSNSNYGGQAYYTPDNGLTWLLHSIVPSGYTMPSAVEYQGKLYVTLGGGNGRVSVYNPGTGTWDIDFFPNYPFQTYYTCNNLIIFKDKLYLDTTYLTWIFVYDGNEWAWDFHFDTPFIEDPAFHTDATGGLCVYNGQLYGYQNDNAYMKSRVIVYSPTIPVYNNPKLLLNFKGTAGLTSWEDEAQNLIPTENTGFVVSSVYLPHWSVDYGKSLTYNGYGVDGYLKYVLPDPMLGDMSFGAYLRISNIANFKSSGGSLRISLLDNNGNAKIGTTLFDIDGHAKFEVMDKENNVFGYHPSFYWADSYWAYLAIVVRERKIFFRIEALYESLSQNYTSTLDTPMAGLDTLEIYVKSYTNQTVALYLDTIEWSNYAKMNGQSYMYIPTLEPKMWYPNDILRFGFDDRA